MSFQSQITFFSVEKRYGEFSNFYPSSITIDNVLYPTVEHYYQVQKFNDQEYREIIRQASTPYKAKILASQRIVGGYDWRTVLNTTIKTYLQKGVKIREDWEKVKEKIMLKGLEIKFQHPRLKKMLLKTKDAKLIENSPTDYYWGVGASGTGKNRLGILLMQVRESLNED
jgi:ribA/ribD-fused uncharacterized protein